MSRGITGVGCGWDAENGACRRKRPESVQPAALTGPDRLVTKAGRASRDQYVHVPTAIALGALDGAQPALHWGCGRGGATSRAAQPFSRTLHTVQAAHHFLHAAPTLTNVFRVGRAHELPASSLTAPVRTLPAWAFRPETHPSSTDQGCQCVGAARQRLAHTECVYTCCHATLCRDGSLCC